MTAVSRPLEAPKRPLRALVLNADFRPLSTWPLSVISAEEAVRALVCDRVSVVENWDAVFRSPSTTIRVPKIVALREYVSVTGSPKFCRRSILLRDRYRCQYCGERFPSHELTFDHFIPRSKKGKTVWSNIVTACVSCNALKADRHLVPKTMPRCPTNAELLRAGLEFLPNDLREDFGHYLDSGSQAYWAVELEP